MSCRKSTPAFLSQRFYLSVSIPWLINSIITNGLQVIVLLATVVRVGDDDGSTTADPLPPGISGLVDRGYRSIAEAFDTEEHCRGLFASSVPIPNDEPKLFRVIAVDPGQAKIATRSRGVFDPDKGQGPNAAVFTTPEARSSSNYFFARRYHFESLASHDEKAEKRRVVGAYKDALNHLSQVSLRVSGGGVAYAQIRYATLDAMMEELMSHVRHLKCFARFRASERTLRYMANSIAYGAEEKRVRNLRGKKRELKKKLYAESRVVFFGHAQFRHGSRGSCPWKNVLRELVLLYSVVPVDEFRISKCCQSCGSVLSSGSRSRAF